MAFAQSVCALVCAIAAFAQLAAGQIAIPCIVSAAAQVKGQNMKATSYPCLVGNFNPASEVDRAFLIKVKPFDACTAVPPIAGIPWVALITRNQCDFYTKALHAQMAGAMAAIIGNDEVGGAPIGMDSNQRGVSMPVYSVGYDARNELTALYDQYGNATDSAVVVSVQLQQARPPIMSTNFDPLVKQFFLFFLPTLLGALFLLCAVLSFVLAYRRQRANLAMGPNGVILSPINATQLRADREAALANLPVQSYAKPSADDDPSQGGIYCSGCAVCLEDFESGDPVRVLPCQHVYHVVCIDTWLIDKGTCPYCKMDFMTKSFPEEKKSPLRAGPSLAPPAPSSYDVVNVDLYTPSAGVSSADGLRPTSV